MGWKNFGGLEVGPGGLSGEMFREDAWALIHRHCFKIYPKM